MNRQTAFQTGEPTYTYAFANFKPAMRRFIRAMERHFAA